MKMTKMLEIDEMIFRKKIMPNWHVQKLVEFCEYFYTGLNNRNIFFTNEACQNSRH